MPKAPYQTPPMSGPSKPIQPQTDYPIYRETWIELAKIFIDSLEVPRWA